MATSLLTSTVDDQFAKLSCLQAVTWAFLTSGWDDATSQRLACAMEAERPLRRRHAQLGTPPKAKAVFEAPRFVKRGYQKALAVLMLLASVVPTAAQQASRVIACVA
jgi:hypothetical protein